MSIEKDSKDDEMNTEEILEQPEPSGRRASKGIKFDKNVGVSKSYLKKRDSEKKLRKKSNASQVEYQNVKEIQNTFAQYFS